MEKCHGKTSKAQNPCLQFSGYTICFQNENWFSLLSRNLRTSHLTRKCQGSSLVSILPTVPALSQSWEGWYQDSLPSYYWQINLELPNMSSAQSLSFGFLLVPQCLISVNLLEREPASLYLVLIPSVRGPTKVRLQMVHQFRLWRSSTETGLIHKTSRNVWHWRNMTITTPTCG